MLCYEILIFFYKWSLIFLVRSFEFFFVSIMIYYMLSFRNLRLWCGLLMRRILNNCLLSWRSMYWRWIWILCVVLLRLLDKLLLSLRVLVLSVWWCWRILFWLRWIMLFRRWLLWWRIFCGSILVLRVWFLFFVSILMNLMSLMFEVCLYGLLESM